MKRSSFVVVVFTLFLLLLTQQTLLAQGTGSISGVVTAPDGITPITDAQVCVSEYNETAAYGCIPVDPVNGTYTFLSLPSGIYRIEANAPDKANEFYLETPFYNLAAAVAVSAPDDTPSINFTLGDGASIGGTITGVSLPLPNAWMCVDEYDTNNHVRCAGEFDLEAGTFVFDHLPTGSYRVGMYVPGYVTEYYDSSWTWDGATPLEVTAPTDITDLVFNLDIAGGFSGIITVEGSGTPITNATVCVNGYLDSAYYSCAGVDASTGEYVIDTLPAGDYRISVDAPGYVNEYYNSVIYYEEAQPFTVTGGVVTPNIDFALAEGGSISGIVTGLDEVTPVTDATVCVNAYNGPEGYGCIAVNGDGTYTFGGLPDGSYRVEAYAPDRENELYPETPFYSQAFAVNVTAPSDTPNINFTLGPGSAISGIISGASLPLDDHSIICINSADSNDHVRCRGGDVINLETGQYTFDHLPSGSYRIDVTIPGYVRQFYNGALYDFDATPVEVAAPTDVSGINFALQAGGGFSGVVTEGDGTTPLSNANVCVMEYYTHNWFGCTGSAPDGTYQVDFLPAGNYRIAVDKFSHVKTYYPNAYFWDDAGIFAVAAETVTPNVNFALPDGGTISGTINTSNAGPLNNASICLNDFTTGKYFGCRGSEIIEYGANTYFFDGVPTGSYRVSVHAENYLSEAYDGAGGSTNFDLGIPVSVTVPNTTPNIDFVIDPAGSISGVVYAEDGVTPLANIPVDLANGGNGQCTDVNGVYTMHNLALNTPYIIKAGGQGWQQCPGGNYQREYWQNVSNYDNATPITLTEGSNQFETDVNFTLAVGGSISGHVSDGTNNIQNASVCVQVHLWGEGLGCASTDANGNFTLVGLPSGNYRADIYADGFANELYDNFSYYGDHSVATAISVTAGQNTTLNPIVLAPEGTISGTVYAADGITPLSGVPVGLGWGGYETCTNDLGQYTIDGLPRYTQITLWAGGPVWPWMEWMGCNQGNYVREYWESVPDADVNDAEPIELTNEVPDAVNKNLNLDIGGTVSGTVDVTVAGLNDSANIGVHIFYMNEDGSGAYDGPIMCTDLDGSYSISGIELNKTFYVTAGHTGECGNPHGFATEWYSESAHTSTATLLMLTPQSLTQSNVNFTLEVGGFISGTVTDAITGLPVQNIEVLIDDAWIGECTDENGAFTFNHVPVNTDLIVLSGGVFNFCGGEDEGYEFEFWQEGLLTPINLEPGGSIGGINFTLSSRFLPSVTLLTPENNSVTGDETPLFSWDVVENANRYRIQIDDAADFNTPIISTNTTDASFLPPEALSGGEYFWRVRVQLVGSSEWSEWSEIWSFELDTIRPDKPVLSQPADTSTVTEQPVFGWEAVTGAVSYLIQIDNNEDFSSPLYAEETTGISFAPPAALADDVWYWRVRAFDAVGNRSRWSAPWSVQVDAIPAQPTTLLLPENGFVTRARSMTFEWAAVDGARKYRLQISELPDFSDNLVIITTKDTTYTPEILLPKGEVFWRVRVMADDRLWSEWSSVFSYTIDRSSPVPPALLTPAHRALITDTNTPAFDWEDNTESDLAYYIIQIDNNRYFTSPLLTVEVTDSTYLTTLALTNRSYFWRVRAVDAVGNKSAWSDKRKFIIDVLIP